MNVKYQIFVSSTYEDLKDERNEVIKACLNMGHIPVGMEMFNAADEEQWVVIQRTIDQCDYYVVIVAHRYGSMTPERISYTEKEYDYAVAQEVPVLGFVLDQKAPWPNDRVDKDPICVQALESFKSKVMQKMVRSWRDKSELQAHFAISLGTTININPRRGWVRAPEAGAADVAQTISNLAEENARLRQRLDEIKSTSSVEAEVDEAIQLLSMETFRFHLLGDRSGQDMLFALVEQSHGGRFHMQVLDKMLAGSASQATRDLDGGVLGEMLGKFELWGLIQLTDPKFGVWELSTLGRKVYKRLDLASRSSRPD